MSEKRRYRATEEVIRRQGGIIRGYRDALKGDRNVSS